jgi:hypothetical protein
VLTAIWAGIALSSARLAYGQDSKTTNPALDFQIPYQAKLDPVFSYKKATFEPYVGGTFTARGTDGRRVNLTLVSVNDPLAAAAAQRASSLKKTPVKQAQLTLKSRPTETFTLVFSASGPLSELSTISQLEHAALGKFSLFLVHREDEKGRHTYEAVISRPIQ